MDRREFLREASVSALSGASVLSQACSFNRSECLVVRVTSDNATRFSLRIAPVNLELAPRANIQTVWLQRQRAGTFAAGEGRAASHRGGKK